MNLYIDLSKARIMNLYIDLSKALRYLIHRHLSS